MNWRSEGWHVPLEIKPFGESGKSAWHKIDSFSFEAGADAMLEALRKEGVKNLYLYASNAVVTTVKTASEENTELTRFNARRKGYVVFIPDDKETEDADRL